MIFLPIIRIILLRKNYQYSIKIRSFLPTKKFLNFEIRTIKINSTKFYFR